MKWIYTLIVLFVLSSCSTQQKYSNSTYQKNNNADDAYFSPNDIENTASVTSSTKADRYEVEDRDYYVNTQDETANPNAANRNTNYSQYSQSQQNTQANTQGNSNASQLQPIQNNSYISPYQPNWGNGFNNSPFSPWAQPGLSVNNINGRWGWSVGVGNNFGNGFNNGWRYNQWTNSWVYDPWGNSFINTNPNFGRGGFVYDPWTNNYVYSPWGFNNGWNNPYNQWGNNRFNNPYCPTNFNNGYGGNNSAPVTNVRNTRRRASNNFMPAVRQTKTNTNTGGTKIIGSTESQLPVTVPTRTAPSTPGTVNGAAPTTGNRTTPTRTQPNYRTYTTPTTPSSTGGTTTNAPSTPTRNSGTYRSTQPNTGTNTNRTTPSYKPKSTQRTAPTRTTPTRTRTAPTRTAPTRTRTAPRTTPSRSSGSKGSSGGSRRRR